MSKAESVANATAALSNARAASPSDQSVIDSATAALAAANALPADSPVVNPSPSPAFYDRPFSWSPNPSTLAEFDQAHAGQSLTAAEQAERDRLAAGSLYAEGEHEATLRYLDAMHHETRGQTIARLESALAFAKSAIGDLVSPLATRSETVTREVTIDPKAPAVAPTSGLTPEERAAASAQLAEPEPFKP
jgi:hypothetical protein